MNDWIIDVVRELGVVGIGLLMFAENVFPPIPSEIIMPLAGYLSARGQVSIWPTIAAGSIGSLAGAWFWYWIGRRLTKERLCGWIDEHGTLLAMTRDDVDRAVDWFHGHGRWSVFLGRLLPVLRTLISLPAGFSRMSAPLFIALSALGTFIWTAALAWAGRFLGNQFQQIDRYIGPLSWIVIAVMLGLYLKRVVQIRRRRG